MRKIIKIAVIDFFVIILFWPSNIITYAQTMGSGRSSIDQMQMLQMRKISVAVTGAVRYPGTYIVNVTDRADVVIEMSNQIILSNSFSGSNQNKLFDRNENLDELTYSDLDETFEVQGKEKPRRNVTLQRRNGELIKVDIAKYFAFKDERWNPYLTDGDIIFVPKKEKGKNLFAVYGGVNVPGKIEFSDGDRITDAIKLAYGLTPRANADSMILFRYEEKGNNLTKRVIRWSNIQNKEEENILIEPGDRLIVLENEDLREDYYVTISGEVRYPGVYPISRDSTKLSTIITMAGGCKPNASLHSVKIYHREIPAKERFFERINVSRGIINPEDSVYFRLEDEVRIRRTMVNVNVKKLLIEKDSTQDIILQPGDKIIIPIDTKTVLVYGQVVIPGTVPFVQGANVEHYIAKAGGFTEQSRSSDVVIIKRATRQWLSPSETIIEDGDYIWVPKEPVRPYSYYLTIASIATSIISVTLSLVIVIMQYNR